jgi:serine/threonine-protein kinase
MKPELLKAETVFCQAVEILQREERRRYVAQTCVGNPELLQEVLSLLDAHDRQGLHFGSGNPMSAPEETRTGLPRRFGRFELVEELDRGGMGIVYRAHQQKPDRFVAIKMIRGGALAAKEDIRRFESEVSAAASLDHPNIVGVYDVGEIEGQPYFSMPYVEGASLATLVERQRWQSTDGKEAARIVATVARAIHYAHDHGIIHRDLKPGNILLDPRGEPHILDFGLAKLFNARSNLTVTGDVLGSPSFMAPEQAAGHAKEVTVAADVYGLGAVLYYLLTGKPPFVADSPFDVIQLVLEGDAALPRTVNPRIGSDLERICLRCLEKDPGKRYASAAELAEDLEKYLQGEVISFPARTLGERLWMWTRKQPGLVLRAAGLVASALVSQISFQLRGAPDSHQHYLVITVIGLWLSGSVLCQRATTKPAHAERARFAWAALDALSVTAILLLDEAAESVLMALYPALVGISGLWFRPHLVLLATTLSELGYLLLITTTVFVTKQPLQHPPHWPAIFMVVLALEGLCVAYMAHRVSSRHGVKTAGERSRVEQAHLE